MLRPLALAGLLLSGLAAGTPPPAPAGLPPMAVTVAPVSGIVLPTRVRIRPAEPGTPREYADFLGKWRGWWGNAFESVLIVESVAPDGEVRAIYAWGKAADGSGFPGWQQVRSRIIDGRLSFGDAAKFEFALRADGRMTGTRTAMHPVTGRSATSVVVKSRIDWVFDPGV